MAKSEYSVEFTPRKPTRSTEEALSEVERELRVRERCYGRWVADGKMSRIEAVDRIERLTAAWLYLDRLQTLQDPPTIPAESGGAEAPAEAP